jgi:hypothetical protein
MCGCTDVAIFDAYLSIHDTFVILVYPAYFVLTTIYDNRLRDWQLSQHLQQSGVIALTESSSLDNSGLNGDVNKGGEPPATPIPIGLRWSSIASAIDHVSLIAFFCG